MFTGIVEAVGRIEHAIEMRDAATGSAGGLHLVVDAHPLDCGDVGVGDSVALNGVCLTVVARGMAGGKPRLEFDVSGETLAVTTGLSEEGPVNLEKALRFGDRLGGHLVAGHVDGIGVVRRFETLGDNRLLEVEAPPALARFIAVKGSVTIDGVSLTVNEVDGSRFTVNLIPHTLAVTTLGALAPSTRVNLEIDLIARYLDRLLEERRG